MLGVTCLSIDYTTDGNVYPLTGHIIYMRNSTSVSIDGVVEATTKKTNTEERLYFVVFVLMNESLF